MTDRRAIYWVDDLVNSCNYRAIEQVVELETLRWLNIIIVSLGFLRREREERDWFVNV